MRYQWLSTDFHLGFTYSLLFTCATRASAESLLKTTGLTSCGGGSTIKVDRVDITYDADNESVRFNVAGSNAKVQNVSAVLDVTAYGKQIYTKEFNPCEPDTYVEQLCPVPAGNFSAEGSQKIPSQYASLVPAIAYKIPDIAAQARLELKSIKTGEDVACIQSQVSNGKTVNQPVVSYVAAGVAGVALFATGASALGTALSGGSSIATGGAGTVSPSFVEVVGWFQGLAMNGMLSVSYPPIYRSFAKNFAFSTGLVSWEPLLTSIDKIRAKTGGNLTGDSVEAFTNATLIFPDNSTTTPQRGFLRLKRELETMAEILAREIQTSVNSTQDSAKDKGDNGQKFQFTVSGIEAFAAQLAVPKSDVFMNVLLIVAIAIAATAVSMILVKVVLELWALFGSFPKNLTGFRKHYWGSIARTITTLILLLYGIWVLYCIFQFTQGDSWLAKTLAAITLAAFTALLVFFCWKISITARRLKKHDGDASGLYQQKEIWIKYSLFYESYRKQYWWLFVPTILYMFIKGCAIAITDGHGRIQTIMLLAIEGVMLGLLLWSRPYERKSGNVINIIIQVIRFVSVCCILVFVEEFGIQQTTQTVTGVVLMSIQSVLTAVLVILIIWNAINACCQANPHRRRRKEMEEMDRESQNLTPLDARNTLLFMNGQEPDKKASVIYTETVMPIHTRESVDLLNKHDSAGVRMQTQDLPRRSERFTGLQSRFSVGKAPPYPNVEVPRPPPFMRREPTLPAISGSPGPTYTPPGSLRHYRI